MASKTSGTDAALVESLSPREMEVLRRVAGGDSYPAIAHHLRLSVETVKTYAGRLRAKIGVTNKVGLAVWATTHLPRE